jgi:hypothetical protein
MNYCTSSTVVILFLTFGIHRYRTAYDHIQVLAVAPVSLIRTNKGRLVSSRLRWRDATEEAKQNEVEKKSCKA